MKEHPSSHYFDFTESFMDKPEFDKATIRIPIRKLVILGGYQDIPKTRVFDQCVLVYEGVIRSDRTIFEYASPDRQGFKSEYTISDGPFEPTEGEVFLHGLATVSEDLNAWVDWEIVAASVRVEETE